MTSLAHLLDGWLLAGTIKDLLAEHVLFILQWAHPHTGISRIPKSIRKGQASLCSHFSSFCLQCKRNHMAKPNFKEGEIKSTSWQEELQGVDIRRGSVEAIFAASWQRTHSPFPLVLSKAKQWFRINNYFSLAPYLTWTLIPCGISGKFVCHFCFFKINTKLESRQDKSSSPRSKIVYGRSRSSGRSRPK